MLLYPSKGEGMFVPESLIFRSDSNGEDLDGYAGAGAQSINSILQGFVQGAGDVACSRNSMPDAWGSIADHCTLPSLLSLSTLCLTMRPVCHTLPCRPV